MRIKGLTTWPKQRGMFSALFSLKFCAVWASKRGQCNEFIGDNLFNGWGLVCKLRDKCPESKLKGFKIQNVFYFRSLSIHHLHLHTYLN